MTTQIHSIYSKTIGSKFLLLVAVTLLLVGCNSQKKAVRYKEIYVEKPAVILLLNTTDKCQPKDIINERTKNRNIIYNQEIKQATIYFNQGLQLPLAKLGYYVIQRFSADEILKAENVSDAEKLLETPTINFKTKYNIDALLFTTLYAWKDTPEKWTVYLRYQLKSTQSDTIIFQVRIKGSQVISYTSKGIVAVQPQAKSLASRLNISRELAQRILILSQINNYVLSNLPVGKFAKDFDKDQNKSANDDCLEYSMDEIGTITIQKMPMEKFEQECFIF